MNTYSVKTSMPSVEEALIRLDIVLKNSRQRNQVIGVVHGYGSTGQGGIIREAIRKRLSEYKDKGIIRTYIPGEATRQLMGFDADIRIYKALLKTDPDYMKGNPGITYVIF